MDTTRWKLFAMMALQFFIWGAWLPLIWPYMGGLGFDGTQQAWVGSAFAIASIVGIFFSNQFADRSFSAERFLAFSHLIGGLAMFGLYYSVELSGMLGASVFATFFTCMLVHSLFYVPTISVTNSLAFAHLDDPARQFGPVRIGGTLGWILAAWPLFFLLDEGSGWEAKKAIFMVAGVASLVMAAYSMTLPHTPPRPATTVEDQFAWLKAGRQLAKPFVLVLFIVTFIDATIHAGYFKLTGGFLGAVGFEDKWHMPIMSLGQIAEIGTMAVLGMVLAKLGWRTTMVIGVLGHAVRFGVFALLPDVPAAIVVVQVLHGVCYAFFFATVYIFVDAVFPKDVRSSAQGWFNLLIVGLGDLAANWLFLPLVEDLTVDGKTDYQTLFALPVGMSLVGALLLALFFRPPQSGRAADSSS